MQAARRILGYSSETLRTSSGRRRPAVATRRPFASAAAKNGRSSGSDSSRPATWVGDLDSAHAEVIDVEVAVDVDHLAPAVEPLHAHATATRSRRASHDLGHRRPTVLLLAARSNSGSPLRKGGGLIHAPGRGLVGANTENPH